MAGRRGRKFWENDRRKSLSQFGSETMAGMKSLTLAVAMAALAFSGLAHAEDKGLVAVAMPTKSSARWIADGDNMVKVLKERGYQTDLQYAEDDVPNQLAQIENMVTKGAKVLVVASIDGTTLSDVLAKAHDAGIKVIAYDRLIRDTPNVDYYATFDNFSRRAAGPVHRNRAGPQEQAGSVQCRAFRRFAGR